MGITKEELADGLDMAATAATTIGGMVPGLGGLIARITGVALASAAAIAHSGKDPEIEIKRIVDADPLVAEVRKQWLDYIAKKFPKDRDTEVGTTENKEDIYED